MGNSRFSHETYRSYSVTNLQNADGTRKSVSDTFSSSHMKDEYNPTKISVRESCDSEANPNSRPIIFGIDFTASMGHISHEMVNEYVPKVMNSLIKLQTVSDPHLMAMGIRDFKASYNDSPLQVSQFEADHTVVEQMQEFYGPGVGGGGNGEESYALAWAFAAFKTKIDSIMKRGKKGYLFTIGDDGPQTGTLTDEEMKHLIGAGEGMSVAQIQAAAAEKYELFHIHLDRGTSRGGTMGRWRETLGNRAMSISDYTMVPELVLASIAINEGMDPEEAVALAGDAEYVVRQSLGLANV